MGEARVTVKGLDHLMAAFKLAASDAPRLAALALHEEASEAFLLTQEVVLGALAAAGFRSQVLAGYGDLGLPAGLPVYRALRNGSCVRTWTSGQGPNRA